MKNPLGDPPIDQTDFWVFGYASLMWRPGFDYVEMQSASLAGYRRDMCFLSVHYRGTHNAPGLVCGLIPDTSGHMPCKGRAYRVDPKQTAEALDYLDKRELITDIYIPHLLQIELGSGRRVAARVYVADTGHAQFVGNWSADQKAAAIVGGVGSEGRSLTYLANLVDHLQELGIVDQHISALLDKANALEVNNA